MRDIFHHNSLNGSGKSDKNFLKCCASGSGGLESFKSPRSRSGSREIKISTKIMEKSYFVHLRKLLVNFKVK